MIGRQRRHIIYSFSIICIFTIVWNNSRALPNERIRIREAVFDKVAKSTPLPNSITPSPNVPRLGTSPETALALIRDNLQCTSSHWPAAFLLNNTWLDKQHNVGFTLVPKCGSTSLRTIQFIISGYFSPETDFSRVKSSQMWPVIKEKHFVEKFNDRDEFDRVADGMEFITAIRDPMSRLVSAYKDKIGRGSLKVSRQWFWDLYGKHIIARYRKNYPNLEQVKASEVFPVPRTEREAIRKGLIPTFPEFVDYVIDTHPDHDAHWAPLTDLIDFCGLNYKLVFQVERLNDQLLEAYPDLGADTLNHISHIGGHQTNTATATTADYLEELTAEQRHKLFQVYVNDYRAFKSIYSSNLNY